MESESKIGVPALADRHLMALAGAVPDDSQDMSLHTLARILRLAG
jgi:hypothetical protein